MSSVDFVVAVVAINCVVARAPVDELTYGTRIGSVYPVVARSSGHPVPLVIRRRGFALGHSCLDSVIAWASEYSVFPVTTSDKVVTIEAIEDIISTTSIQGVLP